MTDQKSNPLEGETLLTLKEAAENFGGVPIPYDTVKHYVYYGFKGIKLESVNINGRYTSKEAIQRFIDRKQQPKLSPEKPKIKPLTKAQVQTSLRRHGIIQ